MKQSRTFFLLALVIAVLILGVAYAAISNITLTVNGNVVATADQGNFKVKFTGTPTTSGNGEIKPQVLTDTTAVMNVSGLTSQGETATAVFTVINESETLDALLAATSSCTNTDYFEISHKLGKTQLTTNGDTTTLTVTVKLLKTPITEDEESVITVKLTASPYQS